MSGIYFLLPALLTILISLLIIRAGAIALKLTGLPLDKAKFQALSAFTGTGFTTREAETVVNHPLRRGIVSWLMILGNAGIVTVIITATSSFVSSRGLQIPINVVLLSVGIVSMYVVFTRTRLLHRWEELVTKRLAQSAAFEEVEVESLLHLSEGYGLTKILIQKGSKFEGKTLHEAGLDDTNFIVLGVERETNWLSAPFNRFSLQAGDRLIVYGYHMTEANIQ
ncbi:MAG: TrkA C-terminal domain-containing protein [Alphaproteobacteria bacterium]|nr:TrkA C-terminal domain-containing protein [Alphaproteobacteria bacterium]